MSMRIDLDQPQYSPGSTVTGTLILTAKHACSPKHIQLKATGSGRIKVNNLSDDHKRSKKYLDFTIYLWERNQHPNGGISAGTHEFPFEFTLPSDLPSTFSGTFGRIKYKVKGWIPPAHILLIKGTETSVDLLVARDVPILHPSLQSHYRTKRTVAGGLFTRSGRIQLIVDLPQTDLLQGEAVPLNGQVLSTSTSKTSLYVYLIQHITYKFRKWSKSTSSLLQSLTVFQHRGGAQTIWSCNNMLCIPSTVPPTGYTDPCEFIDIHYSIKVSMLASGTAKSECIVIPITVGNKYGSPYSNMVAQGPTASALHLAEPAESYSATTFGHHSLDVRQPVPTALPRPPERPIESSSVAATGYSHASLYVNPTAPLPRPPESPTESSSVAETGYSHASLYVNPTAPPLSECYPPTSHSSYSVSLPSPSGGASGSMESADSDDSELEEPPPSYDELFPMS